MVVRKNDNLPEGIAYIDFYYYDRNNEDITSIDQAEKYRFISYDFEGKPVNEGIGVTEKYLKELAKDDPELLEEYSEYFSNELNEESSKKEITK